MPGYDQSGESYNLTRQADPEIVEKLVGILGPKPFGLYLDLGCGTGNYTSALSKEGLNIIGIDPSPEMLKIAKSKYPQIQWQLGSSEEIPLEDASVDGVLVTLSIHHWSNLSTGFQEMNRVVRPGGKCVIFTSDKDQMQHYWLAHYFPKMMQDSIDQMPQLEEVKKGLQETGWTTVETDPYFVSPDLKDHFLYSGKHRPELYLNDQIRMGISSFRSLSNKTEVESGLEQLKADIATGTFAEIKAKFDSSLGDYAFLSAVK